MSEATSTHTSTPLSPRRRLGTFAQAAKEHGVSERTVRNYHRKLYFPAYKMRGIPGVLLDLDEVNASLRRLPKRLAKAGYGSYGGGEVIDLEPQVIISDDRLGGIQ